MVEAYHVLLDHCTTTVRAPDERIIAEQPPSGSLK
jgi:hypothetical protein